MYNVDWDLLLGCLVYGILEGVKVEGDTHTHTMADLCTIEN